MKGERERDPEEEPERESNRGRHYFAAFREAGTLIVVFASIDGLFYKSPQEIHWLVVGIRLDRQETRT